LSSLDNGAYEINYRHLYTVVVLLFNKYIVRIIKNCA